MLNNNKILDDIREDIINSLDDYEGENTSIDELGFTLTQSENADGSVFYNTFKTINYLAENYYDVCELVEEFSDYGIDTKRFFENPESFHAQLYVIGADYLINCIDWDEYNSNSNNNDDDDNYNDDEFDPYDFELTHDVIEFIKENI